MPGHPQNRGFPQYVSPASYANEQRNMAANKNACILNGRCSGKTKVPLRMKPPAEPPAPPAQPMPPVSPPVSPPSSPPSPPPWTETVCDKPPTWCLHSGAQSKPKRCSHPNGALVPGHWCTDGDNLSGFSPCEGKPPAGSAWPHGTCLKDEDASCPGHPNLKISSPNCPELESQAVPQQLAPKSKPKQGPYHGATMAPYPSGPWGKRSVGNPPGTGNARALPSVLGSLMAHFPLKV